MTQKNSSTKYERPIGPAERFFTHAPFSVVTMVARIKGKVTLDMLTPAVKKLQQQHPLLQVRIHIDENHQPWFTSEGTQPIPIELIPRKSADQWIQVSSDAAQIPFAFETHPSIKFILVHSSELSELIIVCHHIICDGLSLAYLARDLLMYLGNSTLEVMEVQSPPPIQQDTLPNDVSLNRIAKALIKRINKKWNEAPIFFDQEDYHALHEAYWSQYHHQITTLELTEAQTTALVNRCREEQVTVNTALTTAFVGAQYLIQGENPSLAKLGIAGSLRNRLAQPVGEGMGFYAGVVTLVYKYNPQDAFWENARQLHKKVTPLYINKNLFRDVQLVSYLDPAVMEARHFKLLGNLIPSTSPRYQKLSSFSKRDDVISALLKRANSDSLENMVMGTAVTNLTRLDFPRTYGHLELDRLIMNPGGAFPLAMVNLVLGAVTTSGKLSLLIEYAEETIDRNTIKKINSTALDFLLH
jgi:NRPS condensation-like uncharacterized protein